MTNKRRLLLKGTVASSTLIAATAAGLLAPQIAFAKSDRDAFKAKSLDEAINSAFEGTVIESSDIKIKAPDIAENGAVVPITVSTELDNVESISIFASENPNPLTSTYEMGEGALGYISTRIKMGKTADIVAIVKVDGKLLMAKKQVKVTIGGCGG